MKKKQTAVDYLVKELSAILGHLETKPMQDLLIVDAINKAKQIEEEQIIDGDILWVYDYETELDFTKQDYDKKLLMDFTPKIYEWIMKPPFNLEHAQHGLACEKFGDVRTDFLKKRSLGNQPSRLGAGIRWVAVTDALPKIASEDYLVVKNGEVSISLFRGDWNEFQCDLNDFQKVTHWSECPKPPCTQLPNTRYKTSSIHNILQNGD